MKTYQVSKELGILMVTLYHYRHPFNFDGARVEFTASERFLKAVRKECMFLTAEDFVELNNNR